MNINASSQTLINTLLQQAAASSKTQDKKRPTFEEVFSKLNARSSKMNANRQPINALLTNEQMFRYYLKETEPKLRVSNEIFSSDELFNPVKDSDPNKVYGSASTLTSDIALLRDPSLNAAISGQSDPLQAISAASARVRAAARANVPAPVVSQYTPDEQADIEEAEMFVDSGYVFLEYFKNTDMKYINDDSKEFLNVIFAKEVGDTDWGELGQYIFDRLNNSMDEGAVVADLYRVMTAFSAMPDELTKYHIPRAIFKLTSPSLTGGNITQGTTEDFKAILEGSEIDLRKRFYNHRDSNGAGLREADGTYSRRTRTEGERQFAKYTLDKFDPIDAVSTFFISDNIARLDFIKTGKPYESYTGEEGWVNPRLLEVQQVRRLGTMGSMITNMLDDMFNDAATEATTNTNINSTLLDDQIIANFARRQGMGMGQEEAGAREEPLFPAQTSSTIAEAGDNEANIDDVLMRVPRRGRGPDILPRRTPARTAAAETITAAMRRTLQGQQGAKV
jgi:hypothetical protein